MEGKANLYYALGELAYAMAKADGKVQLVERQKLHDIIVEGTKSHAINFNVSEIIFKVLESEDLNTETVYKWAMDEMKHYRQYLTEDLKVDFAAVLEKIARAFGGLEARERVLLEKFREDLDAL